MKLLTKLCIVHCALCLATTAFAQYDDDAKKIVVTGSIQSDWLLPEDDKKIGTEATDDKALTNTYAEVHAMNKYVDAGLRMEYLEHPLPGFEPDFKGWGVPYYYIKGKFNNLELTAGHFYEQFGSGFILRTYEERSLGIDNSLLGGRIVYRPVKGLSLKALSGKQRAYWDTNKSCISSGDVEMNLEQWIKGLEKSNTYLTLGASFVNKYEKRDDLMADPTHRLITPENTNAFDVHVNMQKGGLSVLAEYAQKSQDPSSDNNYIYRKGTVAMLSTSYSKKGLSLLLQAKRSDNMSFRSKRIIIGTSSFVNHLPAFTQDQTYALAALYPYATQPDGEWAYQANMSYKFKKGTAFGGKYGTLVKVNYSLVKGIDKKYCEGSLADKTDGYTSSFFKTNGNYYHDINVQIDKKLSKQFKMNLMYMNQLYNRTVVEGHGGTIKSNIFIAEGKYQFNKKTTLRAEAQYLQTKDDEGDWMFGLVELSLLPNWMFTLQDMYNCGKTDLHYYQGFVTFNKGSHRMQLGYGRTRAGFNCSGGVCRWVPASKGLTMSYNYNF